MESLPLWVNVAAVIVVPLLAAGGGLVGQLLSGRSSIKEERVKWAIDNATKGATVETRDSALRILEQHFDEGRLRKHQLTMVAATLEVIVAKKAAEYATSNSPSVVQAESPEALTASPQAGLVERSIAGDEEEDGR